MKFYNIEQNSDEWMDLRRGKFTASSFRDLFMKTTTSTYEKAIYKVVFERLTGESPESFTSEYMERGHDLEPLAVEQYEMIKFNDTYPGGFFELNKWIGASPDRLIGDDGILEIKCPAYNTMLSYLLKKTLPATYYYQVHGQLYVTGRKYCDFMAYHPSLKSLIIRINSDDEINKLIESKLIESIKLAKSIIKQLK